MKAIAERLGIDRKTVYNVARRAGLPNRHVFDAARAERILAAYAEGVPPTEIAEAEGVHRSYVRTVAGKAGLPPRQAWRRRYPLNEQAFDTPTPVGWWLIGLLSADGHIGTRDNLVALTQSGKDADVLYAFLDYVGCVDKPLTELRLSPAAASRTYDRQPAFAARVQSKYMCESLAGYGITPRKTKSLVLSETAAQQAAVWLGILDGDGWVSEVGQRGRPLLGFHGTKAVMGQCSSFWGARLSFQRVTAPTVYRHVGTLHGMRLYGTNATRAARILLASSPVSLQRKRRILERIASLDA
jgi:DNA-binding CsgD family transcriptional regulator